MTKRERLQKKKAVLEQRIAQLQDNLRDVKREIKLVCDDVSWYKEEEQEFVVSRRPKVVGKRVIGCVCWIQNFVDGGTGEVFPIERHEIVKINGEWVYDN